MISHSLFDSFFSAPLEMPDLVKPFCSPVASLTKQCLRCLFADLAILRNFINPFT